jgi:hypothetical protein
MKVKFLKRNIKNKTSPPSTAPTSAQTGSYSSPKVPTRRPDRSFLSSSPSISIPMCTVAPAQFPPRHRINKVRAQLPASANLPLPDGNLDFHAGRRSFIRAIPGRVGGGKLCIPTFSVYRDRTSWLLPTAPPFCSPPLTYLWARRGLTYCLR